MKLEKLKKQLEDLEDRLFMLQMEDHWTSEDFKRADLLEDQIKALRIKIAEIAK